MPRCGRSEMTRRCTQHFKIDLARKLGLGNHGDVTSRCTGPRRCHIVVVATERPRRPGRSSWRQKPATRPYAELGLKRKLSGVQRATMMRPCRRSSRRVPGALCTRHLHLVAWYGCCWSDEGAALARGGVVVDAERGL